MKSKMSHEYIVKYNKNKFDTRVTIKDNFITLEKKKGLFKKEYKIIDLILADDIVIKKRRVPVTINKNVVELVAKKKTYKFICNDEISSKNLNDEICKLKLMSSFFDKLKTNYSTWGNNLISTAKAVGGVVTTAGMLAHAISKNKGEILEAANVVKDIIKNRD